MVGGDGTAPAASSLWASEQRFRLLAESTSSAIFECDVNGLISFANQRCSELFGRETVNAETFADCVHPADRDALLTLWVGACKCPTSTGFEVRCRVVQPEGVWRWVDLTLRPLMDEAGNATGWLGAVHDVHDLVEASEENERFRTVLDATSDLVAVVRDDLSVSYLNPAARDAIGLAFGVGIDDFDPTQFFVGEEWDRVVSEAQLAFVDQNVWNGDSLFTRADGTEAVMSHVLVSGTGADGSGWYASLARDASEAGVHHSSRVDSGRLDNLTGLLNREAILAELERALARATEESGYVGLLCIDIDQFKLINEGYGHEVGDELLVDLAGRLRTHGGESSKLARFGSDEFVVVVSGMASPASVHRRAQHLLTSLAGEVKLSAGGAHVSVCIGVITDDGGANPGDMLRDADATLSLAKTRGRGRIEVFDHRVHDRVVTRLATELELRHALEHDEFVLHYQPVIDLEAGRVGSVEALVRWQHPRYGLLPPDSFLPVIDECGLAERLGSWVIAEACATAAGWPDDAPGGIRVAVNISADQLAADDFVDKISHIVDYTGLGGDGLVLEITEGIIMADPDAVTAKLTQLRNLGVVVSVDDFGTGYSSLSHLTRLPLDVLKVDKSFVQGLGKHRFDDEVTATVVALGHSLGLSVIAEGVETDSQLDAVRDIGCDAVQGFHFSRPVPSDDVIGLLVDSTWITDP